ncbi:MAG: barstar family protein [Atopobiaceae bacterium]|nr:barstar family protein [Atopobiaceae bacterium]MCI2173453.1 barstar family protein [Atopobiaceae bacterium]MCI2207448.1 barstar family protein [Atopobiaceae bacterium]
MATHEGSRGDACVAAEKTAPRPRRILLVADRFASERSVHDYLSCALGFPAYYGHNLSALSDCLGDVCDATVLSVDLSHVGGHATGGFWERALGVMRRCADENPSLSVEVAGL